MSLLDDIIAGATDDHVSTANLLRKVVVVCHRLGASEVRVWAESELNGYPDQTSLPSYRGPLSALVRGHYRGPAGSSATAMLSPQGAPDWFQEFFQINLRQPLAELEMVASAEEDAHIPWQGEAIVQWNGWEAEGKVPSLSFMNVVFADTVVSRLTVRGIIDQIRNSALSFALDLQRDYPDAGEPGGPTVRDAGVQQVIHSITNHIYGDGTNLSIGQGNRQKSVVNKGDLDSFLQAVRELGVTGGDLSQLTDIVTSDEAPEDKRSKLQAFADSVRSGAVVLATEIAASTAADGILEAASQFLG